MVELFFLSILIWIGAAIAAIVTALVRRHPYAGSIIVLALLLPIAGAAVSLAWACAPLPRKERHGKRRVLGTGSNSRIVASRNHESAETFLDSLK